MGGGASGEEIAPLPAPRGAPVSPARGGRREAGRPRPTPELALREKHRGCNLVPEKCGAGAGSSDLLGFSCGGSGTLERGRWLPEWGRDGPPARPPTPPEALSQRPLPGPLRVRSAFPVPAGRVPECARAGAPRPRPLGWAPPAPTPARETRKINFNGATRGRAPAGLLGPLAAAPAPCAPAGPLSFLFLSLFIDFEQWDLCLSPIKPRGSAFLPLLIHSIPSPPFSGFFKTFYLRGKKREREREKEKNRKGEKKKNFPRPRKLVTENPQPLPGWGDAKPERKRKRRN